MGAPAALVAPAGAQSAGPSVTVTPSTGLQDKQMVTVSYSGFQPNFDLLIRECLPSPKSGDDCDFLSLSRSTSSATGSGTKQYKAQFLPNPAQPGNVTCNAATPCVILVSEDLNDLTAPKASAPITFSTTPPPVVPEVPWALALPLTAMGLGIGAWRIGRRRQPARLAG